jgi:rhodanese-related sulfurtransferase
MAVEVPEVTPGDVASLVAAGALLLDVREPDEWEAGHAPAARHIPMREVPAHLDELPRDRRIVAICRSGGRSHAVAEALIGVGFDAVNAAGGMQAWEASDLPVQTSDGAPGTVA